MSLISQTSIALMDKPCYICQLSRWIGPYKSNGMEVWICESCGKRVYKALPIASKSNKNDPQATKKNKKVPNHGLARKEALAANAYVKGE